MPLKTRRYKGFITFEKFGERLQTTDFLVGQTRAPGETKSYALYAHSSG
jgi:hypothetical protein